MEGLDRGLRRGCGNRRRCVHGENVTVGRFSGRLDYFSDAFVEEDVKSLERLLISEQEISHGNCWVCGILHA